MTVVPALEEVTEVRRLYLLDRVDRAIRRVGSPRGAGCGYQAAAVSWLRWLRRPAPHDDSAADQEVRTSRRAEQCRRARPTPATPTSSPTRPECAATCGPSAPGRRSRHRAEAADRTPCRPRRGPPPCCQPPAGKPAEHVPGAGTGLDATDTGPLRLLTGYRTPAAIRRAGVTRLTGRRRRSPAPPSQDTASAPASAPVILAASHASPRQPIAHASTARTSLPSMCSLRASRRTQSDSRRGRGEPPVGLLPPPDFRWP